MYIIINNKKINIITFNTYFSKLKGLMFRKSPIKDGYLFVKCGLIHTFFMRQNIDVCITNKDKKIVYLEENIKPNKIIIPKIKFKDRGYYTYELPLNTIKYLSLNEYLKTEKD